MLALLLAGACGDDSLTDHSGDGDRDVNGDPVEDDGETVELGLDAQEAEVAVGDMVVVTLDENQSVGDLWQVAEEPDEAVLRFVEESVEVAQPDNDGGGGTKTFAYEAVGEGETSFVVANCYRCDSEGDSSETPPEPAEVEFTVEVTA